MPNLHGFNELGTEVACIDCDARGPAWEWTEKVQAKHQREHVREREKARHKEAEIRARHARQLARQKERENAMVYGKKVES